MRTHGATCRPLQLESIARAINAGEVDQSSGQDSFGVFAAAEAKASAQRAAEEAASKAEAAAEAETQMEGDFIEEMLRDLDFSMNPPAAPAPPDVSKAKVAQAPRSAPPAAPSAPQAPLAKRRPTPLHKVDSAIWMPAPAEDHAEDRAPVATGKGAGAEDLGSLTVPELKERCRSLGLKVGGVKSELLGRLQEAAQSRA